MIRLKRVYEDAEDGDGVRVLVERLWPRGLSKERARVDVWMKEVSPSPELRKWYGHDVAKWKEFRKRYEAELRSVPEALAELREVVNREQVTFVYAASDPEHCSALVLKEYFERTRSRSRR